MATMHSTSDSDNKMASNGDVCREFLRGVCKRGSGCRYKHSAVSWSSDTGITDVSGLGEIAFPVCRDSQRVGGCRRLSGSCWYVHGSKVCCSGENQEVPEIDICTGRNDEMEFIGEVDRQKCDPTVDLLQTPNPAFNVQRKRIQGLC